MLCNLTDECISAKLRNSRFGNDEDLAAMLADFEKSAKPLFKDPKTKSWIQFGSSRDTAKEFGIRGGQLALEGYVVDGVPILILNHLCPRHRV